MGIIETSKIKFKRISGIVLIVLLVQIGGTGLSSGVTQNPQPTDKKSEQLKEINKMFESKYSEEMYYQTDKLLLTATKHLMEARKAPAISTVITASEIRNMGSRNLMDVLRKVPGFGIIIPENPSKYAIEVRGIRTKNTEKILFLIDGHRINNQIYGSAMTIFNDLSIENIKRIEIVRGPGSALYGANAFVAVVNLVTKEAIDINGLQLSAAAGSYKTQQYNGLYGYDGADFQIKFHGNYLDTDGPAYLVEKDAQTLNDQALNTNVSLAPGDTVEWETKSDFGFDITYGDFKFNSWFVLKKRGPYIGPGSALNDETVINAKQYFGDLTYSKRLTNVFDLNVRLYADYIDIDNYLELFPEGFAHVYPDGLIGNPSGKTFPWGSEITANYILGNHLLTGGLNYENARQFDIKHIANFNPLTNAPLPGMQEVDNWNQDVTREISAIYLQDVWELNSRASLTVGVRHDYYSDFGNTTNPRAGFVYELIDNLTLKLLYGSAFRAPTFVELYTINNPAEIGNPELDPEKINTYEAGLEYNFFKYYTIRTNYFYNKITDLITLGEKPSPTQPAPYINKGEANVDGVELEFLFNFLNSNYGYLNWSYQDPKDGQNNRLPDVPNWRAGAGLNLGITQYLNANINAVWTGIRPRADGDTRENLAATTLVDLTLIAKNFYKTLEIRGSVYNLFDEDYRDPSSYPVKVPNDFPNNGRSFIVELTYKI